MVANQETIKFKLFLVPTFWDKPPTIKICIDNIVYFDDSITEPTTVEFDATLLFGEHTLTITRYGKTVDQTSGDHDQLILIDSISIDGINVQNIIWSSSYFAPEYPEPWASEQRQKGIVLEESVIGETFIGHNGIWSMSIKSPFYKFLIDRIKS